MPAALAATIDVDPLASMLARLHARSGPQAQPFTAEAGRFAYLVARAVNAQTLLEFGASSHACPTLYLAAAAHDNFGGTVISVADRGERRAEVEGLLEAAGLRRFVELRDGHDAPPGDLPRRIDLVLIAGWHRAPPVFERLRAHLPPGAVVLVVSAPETTPDALETRRRWQRGTTGVRSATLPFGPGLEFAVVD